MNDYKTRQIIYILLLLVALGVFAFFSYYIYRSYNNRPLNLSVDDVGIEGTVEELLISNLSSNTATVSWYSSTAAPGFVQYGTDSTTLDLVGNNDGEIETERENRNIHLVRLTGLEPGTQYFFQVNSGDTLDNNSDSFYNFTTLPDSDSIGTPKTLLISLPQDFTEGLIYSHASNGSVASLPVATKVEGNNATIDISGLKDSTSLEQVDFEEFGVKLYSIDSSGNTYEIIVDGNTTAPISMSTPAENLYNETEVFDPNLPDTGDEPDDPIDEPEDPVDEPEDPVEEPDPEPDPTPTPEPVQQPAQQPQVVYVPVSGNNVVQTPDTALSDQQLKTILLLGGGSTLIILGFSLWLKRDEG